MSAVPDLMCNSGGLHFVQDVDGICMHSSFTGLCIDSLTFPIQRDENAVVPMQHLVISVKIHPGHGIA